MGYLLGLIIPLCAFSIPVTAIILSYKQKAQKGKIRELELQKELLELEIEKQNSRVRLLEEENRNIDKTLLEKF